MTTFCFSLLSLLLIPALVFGYQPHEPVARREALQTFLMGSSAFFAVKPALAVDVLRSKGCYQGQGEACAELATDNALIKSLQAKSFANREKNEKVRTSLDHRSSH